MSPSTRGAAGLLILLIAVSPTSAHADDPSLLAELRSSARIESSPSPFEPVGMAFCLVYGLRGFRGDAGEDAGPAAEVVLGCDQVHLSEHTGFVDYVAGPGIDALVQWITNGRDDMITECQFTVGVGGIDAGPSRCGTGLESRSFMGLGGVTPDLAGFNVDLIRLVVSQVSVNRIELAPGTLANEVAYDVIWEFWSGHPEPTVEESEPFDADSDGELDPTDVCPGTPQGRRVDAAGCSQEQFCRLYDATHPRGAEACHRADWRNDEPFMTWAQRDCTVESSPREDLCSATATPELEPIPAPWLP